MTASLIIDWRLFLGGKATKDEQTLENLELTDGRQLYFKDLGMCKLHRDLGSSQVLGLCQNLTLTLNEPKKTNPNPTPNTNTNTNTKPNLN